MPGATSAAACERGRAATSRRPPARALSDRAAAIQAPEIAPHDRRGNNIAGPRGTASLLRDSLVSPPPLLVLFVEPDQSRPVANRRCAPVFPELRVQVSYLDPASPEFPPGLGDRWH